MPHLAAAESVTVGAAALLLLLLHGLCVQHWRRRRWVPTLLCRNWQALMQPGRESRADWRAQKTLRGVAAPAFATHYVCARLMCKPVHARAFNVQAGGCAG